jgi:hypothetical protein
MPWDRTAPSNPKYRTAEHQAERKRWQAQLERDGWLDCMQPICLMPSRVIHRGERWHLGHAEDGVTYIGPVHPKCNVVDGAKRGNARSKSPLTASGWDL